MAEHILERVRRIALALPEVSERLSHHAPCFFVGNKKPICRFHDADFADWIGVYLDTTDEFAVDWQEIAVIIEGAYRLRASKTLVAKLDRQ
jgi:hypothetical protein